MMAFHLLAEEELEAIPFSYLTEVQPIRKGSTTACTCLSVLVFDLINDLIDDVQSLVAYLGHHFHLSFELLLLTTADEMMPMFDGEIRESVQCVEVLCDRLGVMKPGSESRASWIKVKDAGLSYLATQDQMSAVFRLKDLMNETGEKLTRDLAGQCPGSSVQLFIHLHMIRMTVLVSGGRDTLVDGNVHGYVNSFYRMPENCLSERYMETANVVQALLLKSLNGRLSDDEIKTIHRESVWQSLHFIDHFRVPERERFVKANESVRTGIRQHSRGYVLGGAERYDGDETEKTDEPETSEKAHETLPSLGGNGGVKHSTSVSTEEGRLSVCSDFELSDDKVERSFSTLHDSDRKAVLDLSGQSVGHPDDNRPDVARRTAELHQLEDDIRELTKALSHPQLPVVAAVELEAALKQKQNDREALMLYLRSLEEKQWMTSIPVNSRLQAVADRQAVAQFLMLTLKHVRSVPSSLVQLMSYTLPFQPRSQLCIICRRLGIHESTTTSDQHLVSEIKHRVS